MEMYGDINGSLVTLDNLAKFNLLHKQIKKSVHMLDTSGLLADCSLGSEAARNAIKLLHWNVNLSEVQSTEPLGGAAHQRSHITLNTRFFGWSLSR